MRWSYSDCFEVGGEDNPDISDDDCEAIHGLLEQVSHVE